MSTSDGAQDQQGNSLYAALARTATRSVALYFSRPIRFFRPSKVSGWHSLRGYATMKGHTLTPRSLSRLVKKEGFMLIAKHFIPPICVNAFLGTVLWSTYAESSSMLEPYMINHPTLLAASSGAIAGGMQAVLAAPAENVRLVIEGGTKDGWSHAWKEVFRGTAPLSTSTKEENLRDIRQIREWMRDVRDMAGRGWDGWGFGFVKDVCGFAVFFSIFEVTRRLAISAKTFSQSFVQVVSGEDDKDKRMSILRHSPRIAHATTLVCGGTIAGLAYEMVCRPLDNARKAVHLDRISACGHHSITTVLLRQLRNDGIASFFKDPTAHLHDAVAQTSRPKLHAFFRTLGRISPWGLAFICFEAFGPGIS